jgi:hypothetical protein
VDWVMSGIGLELNLGRLMDRRCGWVMSGIKLGLDLGLWFEVVGFRLFILIFYGAKSLLCFFGVFFGNFWLGITGVRRWLRGLFWMVLKCFLCFYALVVFVLVVMVGMI